MWENARRGDSKLLETCPKSDKRGSPAGATGSGRTGEKATTTTVRRAEGADEEVETGARTRTTHKFVRPTLATGIISLTQLRSLARTHATKTQAQPKSIS